jgi:hypothetical protein
LDSSEQSGTLSQDDAVEMTRRLREEVVNVRGSLWAVVYLLLSNGVPPIRIIRALRDGQRSMAAEDDHWRLLTDPIIDELLDDSVVGAFGAEFDGPAFQPMEEGDIESALDVLRGHQG